MSEPSDERVDQFIIYAGYGEVMHRLQVLEMSLWTLPTRGIMPKTQFEHAMDRVEKWNGTTFGELMRGMKNQEQPRGNRASLTQVPSHEPLAAEPHVVVSLAHELSAGDHLTAATTTAQRRCPHLHRRTGIPGVD